MPTSCQLFQRFIGFFLNNKNVFFRGNHRSNIRRTLIDGGGKVSNHTFCFRQKSGKQWSQRETHLKRSKISIPRGAGTPNERTNSHSFGNKVIPSSPPPTAGVYNVLPSCDTNTYKNGYYYFCIQISVWNIQKHQTDWFIPFTYRSDIQPTTKSKCKYYQVNSVSLQ